MVDVWDFVDCCLWRFCNNIGCYCGTCWSRLKSPDIFWVPQVSQWETYSIQLMLDGEKIFEKLSCSEVKEFAFFTLFKSKCQLMNETLQFEGSFYCNDHNAVHTTNTAQNFLPLNINNAVGSHRTKNWQTIFNHWPILPVWPILVMFQYR